MLCRCGHIKHDHNYWLTQNKPHTACLKNCWCVEFSVDPPIAYEHRLNSPVIEIPKQRERKNKTVNKSLGVILLSAPNPIPYERRLESSRIEIRERKNKIINKQLGIILLSAPDPIPYERRLKVGVIKQSKVRSKVINVIVSTFNRPDKLKRTIKSIKTQTIYKDLNVIVCDDYSNHLEFELLKEFTIIRGPYLTPQEKSKTRLTMSWLINRAINMCNNDGYFAYLTDDCVWEHNHLEDLRSILNTNDDCNVAYSLGKLIHNNQLNQISPIPKKLVVENTEILQWIQNNYWFTADHNSILHRNKCHWPEDPFFWMGPDMQFRRLLAQQPGKWICNNQHDVILYNDNDDIGSQLTGGNTLENILERKKH